MRSFTAFTYFRLCFGICLSSLLILLYKFIKHFWKGGF